MKTSEKREVAKQLFLYAGVTQKEIAVSLDVTEKTVSKWASVGKWHELRGAFTSTKDELVRATYLHIAEIQKVISQDKRAPTNAETDQILKLAKVIETLDKKITLAQIIQVFREFENYLIGVDADLTKIINRHHTAFITRAVNE